MVSENLLEGTVESVRSSNEGFGTLGKFTYHGIVSRMSKCSCQEVFKRLCLTCAVMGSLSTVILRCQY